MMHRLHEIVLQSAGRPAHCICTAAFSGGADSTALLLCLHDLRETLDIDLRAVHVHHGIRGAEADRDAAFCAEVCAQNGIPLRTVYADVPSYAAAHHLSLETAARRLRYQALEQAAPEGVIVTAHHAGDQAETVLFHLLRGSGLRGLHGILPVSGRLRRPLLDAERADILGFLRARGQRYVDDSTNFTDESSRNRLRQEIMPLLLRENPAAVQHIARTAMLLAEDEALLSEQAASAMQSGRDPVTGGVSGLAAYPKPIRMRVYMQMLEDTPKSVHIDPAYPQLLAVDRIVLAGSGTQLLSGDVYARAERGILYMQEERALTDALPMQTGINRMFPGRSCTAALTDAGAVSQNIHRADTKATLDFDKIIGKPCFRLRSPADRITLPAREHSALLKKCVQAAVPKPLRLTLYALYDDLGCIWCEQVGIAARVKPDGSTRRYLTLHVSAEITNKKE